MATIKFLFNRIQIGVIASDLLHSPVPTLKIKMKIRKINLLIRKQTKPALRSYKTDLYYKVYENESKNVIHKNPIEHMLSAIIKNMVKKETVPEVIICTWWSDKQ